MSNNNTLSVEIKILYNNEIYRNKLIFSTEDSLEFIKKTVTELNVFANKCIEEIVK